MATMTLSELAEQNRHLRKRLGDLQAQLLQHAARWDQEARYHGEYSDKVGGAPYELGKALIYQELASQVCKIVAEDDAAATGEPPRRALLVREVLSRVFDIAGNPPADMLKLLDGTPLAEAEADADACDDPDGYLSARAIAAEELTDLRDHIDRRISNGEVTWYDLLAQAYGEVSCARPGRETRRALVGLAAYAVWWAEAIELRPSPEPEPQPGGQAERLAEANPELPGGAGTPTPA